MLGVTGPIYLDESGTRRPDYIFLIVQDGRLMPLWNVNINDSVTWINPEPVKWPTTPFPPDPNPQCVWDSSCASQQIFGMNIHNCSVTFDVTTLEDVVRGYENN